MLDKCSAIARMVEKNRDIANTNSEPVHPKNSFYAKYTKRLIDLIIVIPVFIIFLPINLVIGVVKVFDVGTPIFFKQQRISQTFI